VCLGSGSGALDRFALRLLANEKFMNQPHMHILGLLVYNLSYQHSAKCVHGMQSSARCLLTPSHQCA
jgi:hypothetical protein